MRAGVIGHHQEFFLNLIRFPLVSRYQQAASIEIRQVRFALLNILPDLLLKILLEPHVLLSYLRFFRMLSVLADFFLELLPEIFQPLVICVLFIEIFSNLRHVSAPLLLNLG